MRGDYTPAGAIVPPGAKLGPDGYHGLYPVPASALSCCWVAPHAEIFVKKAASANFLVAGFALPNLPIFARGESLTLGVAGLRVGSVHLDKGQHLVQFRLPAAAAHLHGVVPVSVATSIDYVPAKAGVGSDPRHLGIALLYVYFDRFKITSNASPPS